MNLKSNKTWPGTIVLACILLILAFVGGNWGTSYAKSSEALATPVISSINPAHMPVTSAITLMVIRGTNFGTMDNTRIRLHQWGGSIYELVPQYVEAELIVVEIPGNMTDQPNKYDVKVMVYESTPTVPTLPPIPGAGSNMVTFSVYVPIYYNFPFIRKN